MASVPPQPTNTDKVIKYASLCVLVVQNTSLVLFMKFAMSGRRPKFFKEMSVFFAEIFKFFTAIILVCLEHRSIKKGLQDIYQEFTQHKMDALKVLVPAVIYTIQNILLYVAVENLPSATFMVTYQLKILTTAIFTVVVLKRKLSIQQWIGLLFLFGGVAIVQFDQKMSDERDKAARAAQLLNATLSPEGDHDIQEAFNHLLDGDNSTDSPTTVPPVLTTTLSSVPSTQNSILGFGAVLLACFLSGFAGIYFEKILKGSNVSIWIRNIQLALPSIIFSLSLASVVNSKVIFADGLSSSVFSNMMTGFDWAVWVTIGINAFGGLVVAVVIKFADNILKAFATSFAIVLNCILAYFLFSFRPTMLFVLGACMVIGAVFVYSLYPYRPSHQRVPTEEKPAKEEKEMEPLAKAEA